jgi:small-conductance mechanosensitive channel
MATALPPVAPAAPPKKSRFRKTGLALLLTLIAIFAAAVIASWITGDASVRLSALRSQGTPSSPPSGRPGRKTIVDISPWQTAETLAPQAKSKEEVAYAREAQRLADHEVDQAFASALRQANLKRRPETGNALALAQRVKQLQKVVDDDTAQIKSLTPAPNAPASSANDDDLEILKAQLGLDNDILDDAQAQLAHATGDTRSQIQQELTAHEAAIAKYDEQAQHNAELATVSVQRYSTLAGRIQAWMAQRTRYSLLQQAKRLAQSNAAALAAEYASIEAKAKTATQPSASQTPSQPDTTATPDAAPDHASRLETLHRRADQLQLASIYSDRIQTEQQLATVYDQWSNQLLLQHRLVLHLILDSIALIAFILIAVILCNRLVRHLLDRPTLDPRRMQTLRTILGLSVQLIGVVSILLVCFGVPSQMSTILGLTTAGLTVALQDFILAFLGWFVLMGRNGVRLGDAVEINGVAGDVAEIGLFRTTILETGNSADKGHPTGRRVAFLNKYAINGQYFNFSTVGQWMWDEISVNVPESEHSYAVIEQIHKAVLKETEQDAELAEQEWKRASKIGGLSQFAASAQVNLRPAAAGVNVLIRYVTRAANRFEMRNRLYQSTISILRTPAETPATAPSA